MIENNLSDLDNKELIELLATLEGIDDSLKELETELKEKGDDNDEL